MKKMQRRGGFTLIEMLVVIGILMILISASLAGYSHVTRAAERVKEQQLVDDIATALSVIYQKQGSWPRRLANNGATDGRLDKDAALAFVKNDLLALTTTGSGDSLALSGHDKFGILTPWAAAVVKNAGENASESAKVGDTGATVQDHILHYALDMDGDGIIRGASVGGASINVRAVAIVWSCGKDGKVSPYKTGGGKAKSDDVYSWQPGQTKDVQ